MVFKTKSYAQILCMVNIAAKTELEFTYNVDDKDPSIYVFEVAELSIVDSKEKADALGSLCAVMYAVEDQHLMDALSKIDEKMGAKDV